MKVALLLTFDRLSLRFFGCYGGSGDHTPAIDRFGAASVVFDGHFAENVDLAAKNHAWNCGQFQFRLSKDQQVEKRDVLGDTLRSGGVTHREFVANSREPNSFANLVNEAADCLREASSGSDNDLLIWLRCAGVESPFDSDDPVANYASEIRAIDTEFGRLSAACRDFAQSRQHELAVIVTAAEGADLGEQSHLPEPFRRMGEAVVHTPLLVYATDGEVGTRRGARVQTIDIVPTLCDWFRLPVDFTAFDGHSLLPLVRGNREEFASPRRQCAYIGNGRQTIGIRNAQDYLIAETTSDSELGDESLVQLFAKPEDIWEIHDVSPQNPHIIDELTQKLAAFTANNAKPTDLD